MPRTRKTADCQPLPLSTSFKFTVKPHAKAQKKSNISYIIDMRVKCNACVLNGACNDISRDATARTKQKSSAQVHFFSIKGSMQKCVFHYSENHIFHVVAGNLDTVPRYVTFHIMYSMCYPKRHQPILVFQCLEKFKPLQHFVRTHLQSRSRLKSTYTGLCLCTAA